MESFKELGLNKEILGAVKGKGFKEPTQIQKETIPLALSGKDIMAGSKTGSGKTFAFSASIIQNFNDQKKPYGLILTPTRELAEQVANEFKTFTSAKNLKVVKIYGGVSMNPQIKDLKTANIIVATPGRLLDHHRSQTVDLSQIKTLVLDEADRMLDMGFIVDIEKILKATSRDRQTLLYTATLSPDILKIATKYMNNPTHVQVEQYVSKDKLKQVYYDVRNHQKLSLLIHLLKNENSELSMVFCNTRHQVDLVSKILKDNNIKNLSLHGGLTQNKRNLTMTKFDEGKINILVCTDVSARGIHIDNVSHVYNFDIPRDPKEYTHRIGRTARAGEHGLVINILSQNDHGNFGRVQHEHRDFEIKKEKLPEFEDIKVNLRKENYKSRNKKKGGYFSNKGSEKRNFSKKGFGKRKFFKKNRSNND